MHVSNVRIVLEMDPGALVQRVAVRHEDLPLGEQSVAQVAPNFARITDLYSQTTEQQSILKQFFNLSMQVLASAKDGIKWNMFK